MIVRDPDLVSVLTLGDGSLSTDGYVVTSYDEGDRSFRRVTALSARVDGEFDVAVALARTTLTVDVLVTGSSWSEIRTRHRALLEAVETPNWVLDVDGVVLWRCEVADSASPTPGLGLNASARRVTLTIPARPMFGI